MIRLNSSMQKSQMCYIVFSSFSHDLCLFLFALSALLLEASNLHFSLASFLLHCSSFASHTTCSICSLVAGCPLIILIVLIDFFAESLILSLVFLITFCEKTRV